MISVEILTLEGCFDKSYLDRSPQCGSISHLGPKIISFWGKYGFWGGWPIAYMASLLRYATQSVQSNSTIHAIFKTSLKSKILLCLRLTNWGHGLIASYPGVHNSSTTPTGQLTFTLHLTIRCNKRFHS